MAVTESAIRVRFFEYLFGDTEGYLCIATASPSDRRKTFNQQFFSWPKQKGNVVSFLDKATVRKDVWFCTSLLERAERKKEYCLPGDVVWADLDSCDPETVEPVPPCIIESSPRRFQALWRLDKVVEPYVQENYSKRVAYAYSDNGADPSGWDLTQLLRVPFTHNYKYEVEGQDVPEVKLVRSLETKVPTVLFDALKDVRAPLEEAPIPVPEPESVPNAESVLYKYSPYLSRSGFKELYTMVPGEHDDWSRLLWRLIHICIEAGMENEEVFSVAWESSVNKYRRDNRPPFHLWQDILRADVSAKKLTVITSGAGVLTMPNLITDTERDSLPGSFIDDYKTWAEVATDAVPEYHELSGAILLSSVVAAGCRIDTSYGPMVPNLWGMILGDSTLTRKTTAMRMATDILADVDPDILLATDGSAEGLLTGLSGRPSKVSMFYKDELSGFFDTLNRRDYLAGMPETLTQLYDVPRLYTRRLRKEVITISTPVFIFFGGGIRDKVYANVSEEYVLSGFLPRFLVVSGEADMSRIRRTGPSTANTDEIRADLVERIRGLHIAYTGTATITIAGQPTEIERTIKAELTEEAWQRYGDIEMQMVKAANDSSIPMLALPTFERLSRSLLKLSVLLTAANTPYGDSGTLSVDTDSILQAAHYIQKWGRHTIHLLHNTGKTTSERMLDSVLKTIKSNPDATRSQVMQNHHLTKRQMDELQSTLEERGQIVSRREGRGYRLRAV